MLSTGGAAAAAGKAGTRTMSGSAAGSSGAASVLTYSAPVNIVAPQYTHWTTSRPGATKRLSSRPQPTQQPVHHTGFGESRNSRGSATPSPSISMIAAHIIAVYPPLAFASSTARACTSCSSAWSSGASWISGSEGPAGSGASTGTRALDEASAGGAGEKSGASSMVLRTE